MRLFRITRRLYALPPFAPFDGEGAYRGGSRWNSPGHRMSFASQTLSLAMLEYLVHIQVRRAPADLMLATAALDDVLIAEVDIDTLPADWRMFPRHMQTRRLGDQWLASRRSVGLAVPSAVVPSEWNVLLNPEHESFDELQLVSLEEFSFDDRIFE